MNGYELSRQWFDFAFENPDKNTSTEGILYMWIVENWNRNGQKEKFGLPTFHSMCACGIKSPNTYHKALKNLISYGFIKIIQESKNQNTSTIISLSAYSKIKSADKSADKSALDSALIQQVSQQVSKPEEHNKQINKETKEQGNKVADAPRIILPFEQKIIDFVDHRKKIKKPMTKHALELLTAKLQKIAPGNTEMKIQILDQSILSGWSDVFPLREEENKPKSYSF